MTYFCRWEQCYVSSGGCSCLHTELRDWLNRKLFRQKRAAACISHSDIRIRLLRILVLWLFKQTVSSEREELTAQKWRIIHLVRAVATVNVSRVFTFTYVVLLRAQQTDGRQRVTGKHRPLAGAQPTAVVLPRSAVRVQHWRAVRFHP